MLEAIIFDFDGLILDTEITILQSWQELYQEHGVELPVEDGFIRCIGTSYGPETFDPFGYLDARVSTAIDWEQAGAKRHARELSILQGMPPMAGVVDLLDDARAHGIRLGIGSSSPHSWVDLHLKRLGLFDRFSVVICEDDVASVKPAPDLFIKAAESLQVAPRNAVVLEDSPHGIVAAGKAGIAGVAVPNELTRHLDFNGAMMRVASIAELSVDILDRALRNRLA